MNWRDRTTCVLFGDAAGAAVIGPGRGAAEIVGFTAGTDGSQAEILTLEAGGTRTPFTLEGARRGEHQEVVMKGREVFKEAVHRMCSAAREVLAQAKVGVEDLALVVPHQANLRIIRAVQKSLQIADESIFINVERYGNTGSASVPLALWEAQNQGLLEKDDLVLLTAFGAGFHWAAMLLRY
jgi:3-oxoacyl-[acyl-carrier-protein] synthase-3